MNDVTETPNGDNSINIGNQPYLSVPANARWDERLTIFLRDMPAWVILVIVLGVLIYIWLITRAPNVERLVDMIGASLLTALVGGRVRPSTPNTNIKTDELKTPGITAGTMPVEHLETGGITRHDDGK